MTHFTLSRRSLIMGASAFALAGCQTKAKTDGDAPELASKPIRMPFVNTEPLPDGDYASMYAAQQDGEFLVPAVPWEKIDQRYLRQAVINNTGEGPGKLVVVTSEHALYWTLRGGQAVRYGVGLGKAGFEWSGRGDVKRKAQWPRWHPPEEMIERKPELERYSTIYNAKEKTWDGGMAGGLLNPLGARALYIYQGEVDTLYRLHGSPEWNSIGKSVSSGCVRLINQDVIDLHSRVPEGTEVIVI